MLTIILAYLGGMLTILSPCVLPVVPFVFARSDQPFLKSGLPTLLGMGVSFAFFAVLSVLGGSWVVQANQAGRIVALVVFLVLGLSLLFPGIAERLSQPFVRLGNALQRKSDARGGFMSSLLVGASVGLLWAPCAGPILGLLLAGAALEHSIPRTFGLLLTFALGAATSLGIALFAGGKALRVLKKGLGAEIWIKRTIGGAVLLAVVAIALGLDTRILAKLSYLNTNSLEQVLVEGVSGGGGKSRGSLADEGPVPPLDGANLWLNSPPLSVEQLRGKVVLIDFWTYSCINCLRTLPYLKTWAGKYRDQGLVVIGVHTPEFAFEKDIANVKRAVKDLGITWPVALDNDHVIWSAFKNRYWPAHYFVDANGRVRFHHFGEGNYEESERVIQQLLSEAHGGRMTGAPVDATAVVGTGVEAPASGGDVASPETYLGYNRQEGFVSMPGMAKDRAQRYRAPDRLQLNQWSLSGDWTIGPEKAVLNSAGGTLSFRFRARDLHLVIGSRQGEAIRYLVTIDGKAPGQSHGKDSDAAGQGTVRSHRLYQLIRQGGVGEHTFRIKFLDPGAEVFAFTFG
jgi:cytochrome c biogenesis protein CcdA/thiol-disulfide isomerase/thioredoxin